MGESQDLEKRMGVTHAIRTKLNFLDERLWKRFSARRLELIDTLDLSSRKASEQEREIKRVAEALRTEFGYTPDYEQDFDKLVRAAVQSVRRNRKRSSKSKKSHVDNKRQNSGNMFTTASSTSPDDFGSVTNSPPDFKRDEESESDGQNKFISEIAHLNSDSHDAVYDRNYSRTKHFSSTDKAKAAIDSMIRPRLGHTPSFSTKPKLPPITSFHLETNIVQDASAAKLLIVNYIERSKSCSESVSKRTENLQSLGRAILSSCIAFVLEKSFEEVNEKSVEYLRNKLNHELFLAKFFRDLDPNTTSTVSDEIAVISLVTLLGGCIKDFGFDTIMLPLCEIFYVSILEYYPLIAKNSLPFRSLDYMTKNTNFGKSNAISLNSLAAVAMELQEHPSVEAVNCPPPPKLFTPLASFGNRSRSISPELHKIQGKKQVLIRFLSSVLEFTYLTKNQAPPRYIELLENARQAFKLNDSILNLRNIKDGRLVQSDFDMERIFKTEESIELEVFTLRQTAIPIYEITSAVVPNYNERFSNTDSPKILLPPPYNNRVQISHTRGLEPIPASVSSSVPGPATLLNEGKFNFLSNTDDKQTPPLAPLLPKFQPLL